MKTILNRTAALIVAAIFAFSLLQIPVELAYGDTVGENDQTGEIESQIADQFSDPSNDPFDYTQRSAKNKAVRAAGHLPEAFDLRDVNGESYVTHVKLQDPFGNCWGFAAISAAETSILGDPDNITSLSADTMDLSEKHLSYFAATPIDDPENPQNGEGVIGGDDVSEGRRILPVQILYW